MLTAKGDPSSVSGSDDATLLVRSCGSGKETVQQLQKTETTNYTSHESKEATSNWTRLTLSSPCLMVTPASCQQGDDDERAYDEVDTETFNLSLGISSSTSSSTPSSMNPEDSIPVTDSDEDSNRVLRVNFQLIADQLTFTKFPADRVPRIETEDEVTFL